MKPSLTEDAKRAARVAWWLGVALGVACNLLPPEYRAICAVVSDACRGVLP